MTEDGIRSQNDVNAGLTVVSEVWRSGRVESVHLGAAAVADAAGRLLACAGDPSLASYLRSAAKPVQLAAMLEAGLERLLPLSPAELALCAASHGGEPGHVQLASRLLSRGGLSESDLRCGAAWPLDGEAARRLLRSGDQPTALHNNCSGKHAAMLLTCRANGWPEASYEAFEHPLQKMIAAEVESMAGTVAAVGVDGCGVPTFYLSVHAAARMTAVLMERAESDGIAQRVVAAMSAHPWLTSASQRLPYHLMRVVPQLLAKEGAEGFFVVGIPRQRSPWARAVALAMKVIDGAGEEARGREPGVLAALISLDVLSKDERKLLHMWLNPPILNSPGDVVGEVRGVMRLESVAG